MRKRNSSPRQKKKLLLKRLNPLLTCKLCKGYLVDAATVTECLHTFCKSCIVKYLREHNTCPTCKIIIHQSHPLNYISLDRTLQHIVYKAVPGLLTRECTAESNFYLSRGLEPPDRSAETLFHLKQQQLQEGGPSSPNILPDEMTATNARSSPKAAIDCVPSTSPSRPCPGIELNYRRDDEQVQVCLQAAADCQLKSLGRPFLRLSAQATVTHLKKYVALKVLNNVDKFGEVS